jgi:NADH-quinone oxidoreductase subunit L
VNGVEVTAVAVCALPLLAAVANGVNALTGERLFGHVAVARIAVIAVVASFVASLGIAAAMLVRPQTYEVTVYRFLTSGDFSVDFGFLLDPLSVVMMVVVTGISALVTRFSVNYMHNEDGFTRYFTVVPLFVFAMLVLVMADNYLVMFLGWEGVGVCSYLLIGFYRERPASAQAATRAFVMNRIGDAGLLVAMFLLVVHTGGLQYGEVFAQASSLPRGVVEAVCLLLLLGATGKSAQLPLGTWLARAMEGPTPSSALMHAATMVTAGVYLVVRSAPLYDQAPSALLAVGLVGAATALYGQLVGYAQTDIKGILAASTTAQLGLMFLFCGLGLYAVAIFHLVAHAFYKTYLFLTAPSVLHHLHGGPDPTAVTRPADTGRLLAAAAMAVAAGLLAVPLVGRLVEPAGANAASRNVWGVLALAVIAIFAAAFSARRMTAVAFGGAGGDEGHAGQTQPRSGRLVWPLSVLAGLVALGLAAGVLPGGLDGSWFQRLLRPAVTGSGDLPLGNAVLATLLIASITLLLLSGWYGPRYLDRFREELPAAAGPPLVRRLYWGALNRGYLDDVYGRSAVAPTFALGRAFERFDRAVLDRPPPSATPPAGLQPASWEDRFLALRGGGAAGSTALAETPERLDWLAAGRPAAPPSVQHPPRGAGQRTGAAARRLSAWSTRVFADQGSGRGLSDSAADVPAGSGVRRERAVAQPLDTAVLKLAGLIAGITEAVERVVFQSGVERGVVNAAAGSQRLLMAIERRLGRPPVIGSILALALLTLIVGTR